MPKRWVRKPEWQRQPHAGLPPSSLWWLAYPDWRVVIDAYLEQASRGRTLPGKFKDELELWLRELCKLQNMGQWKRPRTYRYWTVPSYALANGIKKATLMKRLRELEKLARKKFPDRVPPRRNKRPPLTSEEIQQIKARYLAGEDAGNLGEEFRIPSCHVGILCRAEKAIRLAELAQKRAAQESEARDQSEFLPDPTPEDEL